MPSFQPMTDFREGAKSGESCREPRERSADAYDGETRKEKRPRLSTDQDTPEPVGRGALPPAVQGHVTTIHSGFAEYREPSGIGRELDQERATFTSVGQGIGDSESMKASHCDTEQAATSADRPQVVNSSAGVETHSGCADTGNDGNGSERPGEVRSATLGLTAPVKAARADAGTSGHHGDVATVLSPEAFEHKSCRQVVAHCRDSGGLDDRGLVEQGVRGPIEGTGKMRRLEPIDETQVLLSKGPGAAPASQEMASSRSDKLLESLQEFASFVRQACLPDKAPTHSGSQALPTPPLAIASEGEPLQRRETPKGTLPDPLQAVPLRPEADTSNAFLCSVAQKGETRFISLPVRASVQSRTGPVNVVPDALHLSAAGGPVARLPPGVGSLAQDIAPAVQATSKAVQLAVNEQPLHRLPLAVGSVQTESLPRECYPVPTVQIPQGLQSPIVVEPGTMVTILGQQPPTKFVVAGEGRRPVITGRDPVEKLQFVVGTAGRQAGAQHQYLAEYAREQGIAEKVPGIVQVPVLMGQQVCPTPQLVASTAAGGQLIHSSLNPQVQPSELAALHRLHHVSVPVAGQLGALPFGQSQSFVGAMLPELPLAQQEPLSKITARGLLQVYSEDMRFIFFSSHRALYGDSAWEPAEFHYTDLTETEIHGSPLAQRFFFELIHRLRAG